VEKFMLRKRSEILMDLTKEQLLVILKKAYMRGVWEHVHQKRVDMQEVGKVLNIPDSVIEDLIEENTK
jgi:hypothetical protein